MAGPFETGGNYLGALFGGGAGAVLGAGGGAVKGGIEGGVVGTLIEPGGGTIVGGGIGAGLGAGEGAVVGGAAGGTAGWIIGGRAGRWADDKLGYGDQSKCDSNCSEMAKTTKKSGKEKSSDAPSWAKGQKPLPGESGKDFAGRLMDNKYGPGQWKNDGPGSEFNQIKKYGDRR